MVVLAAPVDSSGTASAPPLISSAFVLEASERKTQLIVNPVFLPSAAVCRMQSDEVLNPSVALKD